jgi:methyltransferase (TIGR00027 family)
LAAKLKIFEVDHPDTQAWKRRRLRELGFDVPDGLHFVPVDFEKNDNWQTALQSSDFDLKQPAVVASTGVSMYLTKEAIQKSLIEISKLAPGSHLAMTFLLPLDMIADPVERAQHEMVYDRARQAGTPFLSFFRPPEIMELALSCGFGKTAYFSTDDMIRRYFQNRSDGFHPSSGEAFLIASC